MKEKLWQKTKRGIGKCEKNNKRAEDGQSIV